MNQRLYEGLNADQLTSLSEAISNNFNSHLNFQNTYIPNTTRLWMAIFAKYLTSVEKVITLRSCKYYYKQDTLDNYFPTNRESQLIAPPFDRTASQREFEIMYVDTTTGAKIYEYASELCKAEIGYVDKRSLAVSLTEHKNHKVKIIQSNNTVWILSNEFNETFIEKTLALFPYLFSIQELISNRNVIDCCKAVAKNEPIKDFCTEIFKEQSELIKLKKRKIIEISLNARNESRKKTLQRNITNYKRDIESKEQELTSLYNNVQRYLDELVGIETRATISPEALNEIVDYIERNKLIAGIHTISTYNTAGLDELPQLEIVTPLSIYDPEPLDRLLNNRFNDSLESTRGLIEGALRRIFIDEKYTLYTQTFITINIVDATINGSKSANNKSTSDFRYMTHPHFERYNCWGDNSNNIKHALVENDLINAINIMLVAAQSVNFTDTAVLSNWIETIYNSPHLQSLKSCKSKENGEFYSFRDVMNEVEAEYRAAQEEVSEPELEDTMPF